MNFMMIKTKQHAMKVRIADIYYIKSHPVKPHYIEIVTEKRNYDVLEKLQNIESLYSDYFVRCHRNCLVNISKVTEINLQGKTILLGDEGAHQVRFSRRRYQQLVEQWLNKGDF
ncbi:LytTR family DNA-binding domain-containing protein [Streptococcus pneumoniae]